MANAETARKKRQRFRRALREAGLTPEAIERILQEEPDQRWITMRQAMHSTPEDQKLRRELRARGLSPGVIEQIVHEKAVLRQRRNDAHGAPPSAESIAYRERLEAETYRRLSPDDRRHRPVSPSSLETGPGRAVGVAARAARRGRTFTAYEYQRAANGGSDSGQ